MLRLVQFSIFKEDNTDDDFDEDWDAMAFLSEVCANEPGDYGECAEQHIFLGAWMLLFIVFLNRSGLSLNSS